MDTQDLLNKIKQLEAELNETKQHLKKYTAPNRSKTYYENHKDEILVKIKNKQQQPDYKEKRKEYNRISYLRKKQNVKTEEQTTDVI